MAFGTSQRKTLSFVLYLQRRLLLLLAVPLAAVAVIWSVVELTMFSRSVDGLRETYVMDQKQNIRSEVASVAQLIDGMRYESGGQLWTNVRERTDQAWQIVDSLYRSYGESRSREELVRMAVEALRPIRYDGGQVYYFITELTGKELLFSARPELEGLNLLNLKSSDGQYVVRDMIDIVRNSGEGYYSYTWTHPDREGDHYEKTSYVKLFEPLGFLIGCGAYEVDAEQAQQRDVLALLSQLSFGNEGYVFVYRLEDGVLLYNRGDPSLNGKEVRNWQDGSGRYIFREMEELVRENQSGGYLEYDWSRVSTGQLARKVSWITGIPGWNWIIGRGIYLDEVDLAIAKFRSGVADAFGARMVLLILLIACAVGAGFLFMRRVLKRMQSDIGYFGDFFRRAFRDNVKIPLDDIALQEFRDMATIVNEALTIQHSYLADLAAKEQRYRSLFEASNDAVFIHAIDGALVEFNRQAEQIFPFLAQSSVRYTLAGLFADDKSPRIREYLDVLLATGAVRMEVDTCNETGRTLYLDMSSTMINKEEGLAQTLMRDISPAVEARLKIERLNRDLAMKVDRQSVALEQSARELQQARELLVQTEKMASLGQLVSVLGHEIGTPLGIGITLSSLLEEQARTLERKAGEGTLTRSDLDQFLRTVNESAQLVNHNLLRASELMSNAKTIAVDQASRQLRDYNLPEYVGKIVQSLEPKLRKTKCSIELEGESSLNVHGDPGMVYQVITNLVNNSLLHAFGDGSEPGQIRLGVRQDGEMFVIDYRDNGRGIPVDLQEKVFEQYFTTRRAEGGTGIGLHVVRTLVQQAGGFVTLDSSPGEGVHFAIRVPMGGGQES